MRTAPLITPPPTKAGAPNYVPPQPAASATQAIPMIPPSVEMDREFILRNQIAERYIAGRLPLRGTHDFERYCRQHPEFIQELGMAERVHAALRLLEAGGIALPWEAKARAWWEQLPVLIGVAALAIAAAITAMVLAGKISGRDSYDYRPASPSRRTTPRAGHQHAQHAPDTEPHGALGPPCGSGRRWRRADGGPEDRHVVVKIHGLSRDH